MARRYLLELDFRWRDTPERNVLPRQGELNLDRLTQVIAFMGEAGTIKTPLPAAKQFADLQYLHAAGIQ